MKELIKSKLVQKLNLWESKIKLSSPQATILTYHSIAQPESIVDVDITKFKQQINWLVSNFQIVDLSQIVNFIIGKFNPNKPIVAVVFDDGYENVLFQAYPILKNFGVVGTVFALAEPESAQRQELASSRNLLSAKQLKTLADQGWEIGCHSATHADFLNPNLDWRREIIEAKSRLEQKIDTAVNYFAFPKGRTNPKLVEVVIKAGYRAAFTTEPSILKTDSQIMAIGRVGVDRTHTLDEFKAFFTIWGRNYLSAKTNLFQKRLQLPYIDWQQLNPNQNRNSWVRSIEN